ncbi:hypothetical protein HanRHA438_Chr09g0406361 [Helianthus annuus]|nr:hypothetical protein HanRHA438_Chr09g0406361 [Helianthus annuus]
MMTTHNMRIPDFFQPRQQGGPAGAGERFDPDPPFRVFGESSSRAAGRQQGSEESASEEEQD